MRKDITPARSFGQTYSLRQRYIFITSAVTITIIAFAWLAHSYMGENSARHLSNIEQRNRMAQTVRLLRDSVLEIEKSLDAFMWEPGVEKRMLVHQNIDKAAHYFDKLQNERWFSTLGYAGKLGDFGINVVSLHAKLDQIMDTRLNARRNTPVIAAIAQTMQGNSQSFIASGRELRSSLEAYANPSDTHQLHHLLGLILQRWTELNVHLDIFLEERSDESLSSHSVEHLKRINLLYDAISMQLENISQTKHALLIASDRARLEKMRSTLLQWQQGYNQIRSSSPEEYLRSDIPYLKHTIEPHFEHLWHYLSALDQNIERYSTDEASRQQIINQTITNGVWAISIISVLVLLMGYAYFERGILTPIARVARALRAEARGEQSIGLPRVNSVETRQLVEAFDEMRNQVQDRQQALEHQALHDSLTSLPNRYHWQNSLEKQCRIAQEKGQPLSVLMLGLDRFKDINDTLGHSIGDRVLQLFGERIQCLLNDGDMVARLGSDEFAILLRNSGQEEAILTSRRLLDEIEHPFQIEQISLYVGCSIGIALFPSHATRPAELTRFADIAMHIAKQMKTGYTLYERKLDTNSIFKLSMATDLRHAIQHQNLELYFQPQQFLHNREFAGMEVLLRWKHPVHGFVSPESFIPIAEQTGVIHPITLWVLERTFEHINRWNKQNRDPGLVSINISVFNLQASDFVHTVDTLIRKWQVNPEKIMLEITETAMMADPVNAKSTLDALNRLGLKLAIDDFGTGFSSLAYIKQLPVDELKIDKSFVSDMVYDENDAVIVHSTIDLAHNLGLKVVAEGVEDAAIVKQLELLQCDVVQGHYIGKPLPLEEIEKLLPPRKSGGKVRHIKDYR